MSRSGYTDDCEYLDLWRNAVERAIKGKRGQAFLRELAAAMDAMPVKELISNDLQAHGSYCTLGVVGQERGLDMVTLDPECRKQVAQAFGIAPAMAAEIMFENDEGNYRTETPAQRWARMRNWVADNLAQGGQEP